MLEENSTVNDCEELVCDCYTNLLEDYFGYERHDCNYEHTVQEIANMYPNDIVLMRIEAHLTISVKGVSVDIFDCTQDLVDCYWLVRKT